MPIVICSNPYHRVSKALGKEVRFTLDQDRGVAQAAVPADVAEELASRDGYEIREAPGADTEAAYSQDADATDEESSDVTPIDALRSVDGIGPAYATQLVDAGITSRAMLADADIDELSASSGIDADRLQTFIDAA